jgi:hypothetical protein
MKRTIVPAALVILLATTMAGLVSALPGQPAFTPQIYADGEAWGTKVTTVLPDPMGMNMASFDKLFVIINSNNPDGQMPVGEAAPGNPDYNGGRWYTHTVEWTEAGFEYHGIVPVLMSYDDVMLHEGMGHLVITPGTPGPPPPPFFSCPLLPVKGMGAVTR